MGYMIIFRDGDVIYKVALHIQKGEIIQAVTTAEREDGSHIANFSTTINKA